MVTSKALLKPLKNAPSSMLTSCDDKIPADDADGKHGQPRGPAAAALVGWLLRRCAVSADLDAEQMADRRQQEDVGQQAADDRDAQLAAALLCMAVLAVRVRLEQQGAQRGAERQRIERRDDRRGGDGQRELLVRTAR